MRPNKLFTSIFIALVVFFGVGAYTYQYYENRYHSECNKTSKEYVLGLSHSGELAEMEDKFKASMDLSFDRINLIMNKKDRMSKESRDSLSVIILYDNLYQAKYDECMVMKRSIKRQSS